MITGLWKKIDVVCGCHENINSRPLMYLKPGHRSMFYCCPRYYPDAREATDTACVNHVSTDDFQKILEKLSQEAEENMAFGQPANLLGLSFKVKSIDVKVIEHTDDKIVIEAVNNNALVL